MSAPSRVHLTEAEVASRLSVSRPTLVRWRKAGIGPLWSRLGPRRVAYDSAALDAWLRERERAPLAA